jgi:hypothetical protein
VEEHRAQATEGESLIGMVVNQIDLPSSHIA